MKIINNEEFMEKFIANYLGKKVDIDGGYGVQCVDAAKIGMTLLGIYDPPTTGTGLASGYWYNYDKIKKLSDNFTKVTDKNNLKVGDMLLWSAPHVGWYTSDKKCFSQNQSGKNDEFTKYPLSSFSGFLGALRYRGFTYDIPKGSTVLASNYIISIAKDVISGNYGNGEDRKNRLFSYFQTIVNIKIKGGNLSDFKDYEKKFADDIINGIYGNGEERKEKIYKTIQAEVNKLI